MTNDEVAAGGADRSPPATSDAWTDNDRSGTSDDERWLVIKGRRWRRTDPALPGDLVASLTSHLGRGRSAVRMAKSSSDPDRLASARTRVGLAKRGLGERGPYWWDRPEPERLAQAREALADLETLGDG